MMSSRIVVKIYCFSNAKFIGVNMQVSINGMDQIYGYIINALMVNFIFAELGEIKLIKMFALSTTYFG